MLYSSISALGMVVCSYMLGRQVQIFKTTKERKLYNMVSQSLELWNNFLEDTYSVKDVNDIMERFERYVKEHKKVAA